MTRARTFIIVPLFVAATLAAPAQAHASGWSSLWFTMMNWVQAGSLADGRYQITVLASK